MTVKKNVQHAREEVWRVAISRARLDEDIVQGREREREREKTPLSNNTTPLNDEEEKGVKDGAFFLLILVHFFWLLEDFLHRF